MDVASHSRWIRRVCVPFDEEDEWSDKHIVQQLSSFVNMPRLSLCTRRCYESVCQDDQGFADPSLDVADAGGTAFATTTHGIKIIAYKEAHLFYRLTKVVRCPRNLRQCFSSSEKLGRKCCREVDELRRNLR